MAIGADTRARAKTKIRSNLLSISTLSRIEIIVAMGGKSAPAQSRVETRCYNNNNNNNSSRARWSKRGGVISALVGKATAN